MISPNTPRSFRLSGRDAFSLVEVTMALGIVAFSMLAILGALPVGLSTARESAMQVTVAKISQQVRGELSYIPFTATTEQPLAIDALASTTDYYSLEGVKTNQSGAYFEVTYDVRTPSISGQAAGFGGSARTVTVTTAYPADAPIANRATRTFSFFTARQANN